MRTPFAIVALWVVASTTACASSTDHPPPAVDPRPERYDAGRIREAGEAGEAGDGGDTGDAAPGTCSGLSIKYTYITEGRLDGPTPSGAGGAVVDGTYDVSKVTTYDLASLGPTGRTYAMTVRIGGTRFDKNQNVKSASFDASYDVTGTFTVSGSSMSIDETCPSNQEGLPYTATATTLTLYYGNQEVVLTKR